MFGGIGLQEMVVIAVVAVLLFGRKLPEVARNAGSIYRDFRKQVGELQSTFTAIDLETPVSSKSAEQYDDFDDESEQPVVPRFEPPPVDED